MAAVCLNAAKRVQNVALKKYVIQVMLLAVLPVTTKQKDVAQQKEKQKAVVQKKKKRALRGIQLNKLL